MEKLFLSTTFSLTFILNAQAAASYAKASSSALPTGIIILLSVIAALMIFGIIWLIIRPVRRRRAAATAPAQRPRVIRPRMRPRRRVIIVR